LNEKEEPIYQELKKWRNDKAREMGHSSFTINTNEALKLVAKKMPQSKEELLEIKGFGKIKVEKYGDKILEILESIKKEKA